jgi:hypothetical protein
MRAWLTTQRYSFVDLVICACLAGIINSAIDHFL